MASTAILSIKILTDASAAARGMDQASSKVGRFQSGMSKLMAPAAVAGAAVLAFGKASFDAASKVEQSMGAVDAVFGKSAGTVRKWATEAAQAAGLSKSEYGDMAAVMGAQLKNMGVAQKDLAGETNGLITMGADLAAQFGGPTSDAVAALSSLMRGETDPIEKYGVSIKEADIAAQMAADGTAKLKGEQAKAARTQAIMTLLTKQTADAQGAFARESDTAAVSQQKMNAEIENAQASIGAALLPAVAKVTAKFAEFAQWAGKNATLVQVLAGVILTLVAAVFAINGALAVYNAVMVVSRVVNSQLEKQAVRTWLAVLGPIGLVIAAIALVVVAIVLLWKKSETFRTVVLAVWGAIKTAARAVANAIKTYFSNAWNTIKTAARVMQAVVKAVWNAIKTAVNAVTNAVAAVIAKIKLVKVPDSIRNAFEKVKTAVSNAIAKVGDMIAKIKNITVPGAVKTAFEAIKTAADKVIGVIEDIISALKNIPTPSINWPSPPKWFDKVMPGMVAPPTTAPTVATTRGPATAAAGSGGSVTINVTGAVDPEAVARQIQRILSGHSRRVGLST